MAHRCLAVGPRGGRARAAVAIADRDAGGRRVGAGGADARGCAEVGDARLGRRSSCSGGFDSRSRPELQFPSVNREEINEYDLGLPVPIASLEERRRGIPAAVWDRLHRAKAKLGELFDRAYHVAFHAASALLVHLGEQARTHRGVYSLLEKRLVIPGHLAAEHLAQLARLQEQRSVADHGASRHVQPEQMDKILADARALLAAARVFLASASPESSD